jgi:hypothetical protein
LAEPLVVVDVAVVVVDVAVVVVDVALVSDPFE